LARFQRRVSWVAFFCGAVGAHRFLMHHDAIGVVMVLVSVLTCGVGTIAMAVLGIVDGARIRRMTLEQFRAFAAPRPWVKTASEGAEP
jgi:hypothetical protein